MSYSLLVDIELQAGQMSQHDVYLVHSPNVNTAVNGRSIAIRYMPATAVFRRDLIEPSDKSGFKCDFSQRPLWLARGQGLSSNKHF